ncbi:hypothetical protein BH23BAC2_BH23BAC2_08530 [soil metagenome]
MRNNSKIIFGLFLLAVLFLTYLEASEPAPVNWNPSYLETDKIALGTFVFYDSWKNASPGTIENIEIPPFEFLSLEKDGTYFFLNDGVDFDDAELDKLLSWVEIGNTLFISAGYIGENLLDTLNLEIATRIPGIDFKSLPRLKLVNPEITRDLYTFDHETPMVYFSKMDSLSHTVLGVSHLEDFENPGEAFPNFISSPWGNGSILIHTIPKAFSNYFILKDNNYEYAQGILGYINPVETLYWDKYYKAGKTFYTSPLFLIMKNKPLKWAYYTMLAGALLFIIFEGKRKQRAVKVLDPVKNQSVEYSRTISDLYIEQKKFKALASKKIEHFYDYIRQHYRIDTTHFDDKFYSDLASKSENSIENTKELLRFFREILNKKEIEKNEFKELIEKIRTYKNLQ